VTTKLNEAFDVENEEAGGSFDMLPAAKYNVDLMSAEVVSLESGKGQAVKTNYCVYDGEYEGRWFFDQVIIQHESESAQKFGRRKFKDICIAWNYVLNQRRKRAHWKALHGRRRNREGHNRPVFRQEPNPPCVALCQLTERQGKHCAASQHHTVVGQAGKGPL